MLLVEIASASLRGDTQVKAGVYARHGLREYWVVAIEKRELIVHRAPTAEGYDDIRTYAENESASPLARTDALIAAPDLMP